MLHTFKLIKNLILKNLLDCKTYDEFKMITWILFVTAHDKHLIGNRTSSTMVRDSLCALMKRIPPLTTDQIIDLGVLLTVRFRPVHLSVSSRNWRVDNVPNHLRLEGFNHPLNLLYSLTLIPPTQQGLKVRALMGFITVQLMLGVRNLVISNGVLLSRMWLLMSLNLNQWMGMQASHTTTRAFICMIDSVLYSVGTGLKPGSAKHHALRHFLELVDGFRKSLPEEESRTLDPIQLRKIVQEICNRWSFLVLGEDSVQLGGGKEILKKLPLED
ncbi:uncharacterized protein LOC111703363 [Eurytemora carolleeae]|uniref:uncharacterized protein LOC111703363 n=1 Tax=Eurytemora carolleeae TaxID=1294199 RepID=UPI000C77693D|nr:uncharacterized protein LOC111703363 [Eurytemora carolleeae]|eukprot:XP_023331050.1 uncharacterized protein LOC111703363 [Eurytemora affinis]